MAKKNYSELSKKIIELVGGKDNIVDIRHCITRLRFDLKDNGLIKEEELKSVKGVVGLNHAGDELQLIIGQDVADLYPVIAKEADIVASNMINENLDKEKLTIGGLFNKGLTTIAACVSPLLPMMIAGGMIKVLYYALNMLGILPADSSTYKVLSYIGDAWIYFYPIFVAQSAAKQFKCNQGLAMLLASVIVYPAFLANVGTGVPVTLFGLPVYITNYAYTVLPAILMTYVLSIVERYVTKYSPASLRNLLVPFITALIMLPLDLVVVAPVGYYIGTYVVAAVKWIQATFGWISVAIYCAITPLMVITSMHRLMTPYWVGALTADGKEGLCMPTGIVSNVGLGALAFAIAAKVKNKDVRSQAFSAAVTAFIGGISEPTLFGFVTRSKKLLASIMIGNFVGGAILGLNHVVVYANPGVTGVFAILAGVGENPSNVVWLAVAVAVGFVTTFLVTYLFGADEKEIVE